MVLTVKDGYSKENTRFARVCPECNRTPTWTDPKNPNHIICSRCDLECLLTPLTESERIHAENLARVSSPEYLINLARCEQIRARE
jgi:hypothetical protein